MAMRARTAAIRCGCLEESTLVLRGRSSTCIIHCSAWRYLLYCKDPCVNQGWAGMIDKAGVEEEDRGR